MINVYRTKEAGLKAGISYETLKFYCKEGLVPNVKRDKNNCRIFDERNIAWLKSLQCLKKCGMSLSDMKKYMEYCLQGKSTINKRQAMLANTKKELEARLKEISSSIEYIENKERFYNAVLEGTEPYRSNLIDL